MSETAKSEAVATREAGQLTIGERFLADVQKQFEAQMGFGHRFTEFEQRLTQHMWLKLDQALKDSEARRKGNNPNEFSWRSIDRQKLALDTVHRVSLGLDALIPNHIHPVFYWNTRKGQYDVDLQVGFVGLDYVARRHALEEPVAITYELVYSSDEFSVMPRSGDSEYGDDFSFKITKPFDRGEVVGGFGYITYENPRKNRLVLVGPRDFKRAKTAAKSDKFWNDHDLEMLYKTVVRRVASKIPLDPEKVNAAAFAAVTADEFSATDRAVEEVTVEASERANRLPVDVEAPRGHAERYHDHAQTAQRPAEEPDKGDRYPDLEPGEGWHPERPGEVTRAPEPDPEDPGLFDEPADF